MNQTSKQRLIEQIRALNGTVGPRFLAQFDESALRQYHQHLKDAADESVRIASWVRRQPERLRMVS